MTQTDDLWMIYGQQILKQAAPNFDPTKQQFSLASSTLSVDLGNPDPAVANGYIFNIGNTIPANSPSYAPASALFSAYDVFLDSIDLKGNPDPNIDNQINLASAALTTAQTNFGKVQLTAITNWNAAKTIDPNITFSNFVNQQYPMYNSAMAALNGATSQYQQLMVKKYGVGYSLIQTARNRLSSISGAGDMSMANAFNMPVKTGSVAPAGSVATLPGQDPPVPASALQAYYAPSFSLQGFSAQYAQWQANSANGAGSAVSLHVDSSTATSGWAKFGYSASGKAQFAFDFISAFASTNVSQNTQTSFATSGAVSLDIDFVGLNSFVIAPGPWFDQGILATYKNQLVATAPKLFTADGAFGRMAYEAVIGFEPTITMTMAQADYASFASQFKSTTNVGVGIGPFVIGKGSFSTYSDKSSVHFDDTNTKIVVSPPPSTVPLLLGILSTRLDV